MKNPQFVSVIIPCYQEEKFIGGCLDSLVQNSWPSDRLEILVMDGGSTDSTREVVNEYAKKHSFIKLRDNPGRFPSSAMNEGIRQSKGEIIIRCDAHAGYEKNYLRKLVDRLSGDASIGNVGGMWVNTPADDSPAAAAIALGLGSRFCVGMNSYRTGSRRPVYVDTVPFGAWRREVFDRAGLFNDEFVRAQDLEFNLRLRRAGYKILLDPGIKIYYYPRKTFGKLYSMMFQVGYWKNFVNKKLGGFSSARQLAPPFFVLYLLTLPFSGRISVWAFAPAVVYLLGALAVGLHICRRAGRPGLFPYCAAVFMLSHFGYGAGYIKGFWDFFVMKKSSAGNPNAAISR